MHFIFDANLSFRLAEGLAILESGDTQSQVKRIDHIDSLLERGASDELVIQEAGKLRAIIISQDDDFRRIKSNLQLIQKLGVGYVMYRPPRHGSRYWEIVQSFITGWPKLKEVLTEAKPPFCYQIDRKGSIQNVPLF